MLRRAGLSLYGCLCASLVLASTATADARTRSRRQTSSLRVALEPFSLAAPSKHFSTAVHFAGSAGRAIARAAVVEAPKVIAGTHSRPAVQLAYYAPRATPLASTAEDDAELQAADEQVEQGRNSGPTVGGNRAVLRGGIAYAPSAAPTSVKSAIWALNTLRRKPYVWGGGHGSFNDLGYDCSGTVSFALHHAGVLDQPMPSSDFLRFGERGRGRWITIYSRPGHTFAAIAGLRLDTTDMRTGGDCGPRWHIDGRDTRGYDARHPVGL